jgi:hypothetical protein
MEEEARGRTEVDPPALALASPVAAAARKTVRMSAARDVIIPDYTTTADDDDQGSFAFIAEEGTFFSIRHVPLFSFRPPTAPWGSSLGRC